VPTMGARSNTGSMFTHFNRRRPPAAWLERRS